MNEQEIVSALFVAWNPTKKYVLRKQQNRREKKGAPRGE